MTQKPLIGLFVLFATTSVGAVAQADTYSYTALTAPNTTFTAPRDINNLGVVTGRVGATGSFTEAGGVFTNIGVPGATRTVARGINDAGDVVGFYKPSGPSGLQAFIRSGAGYSTFSFAGADATQGTGINDTGSFVGGYMVGGVQHAFQNIGGVASEISVAGAVAALATGINNSGDVVGYYMNAANNTLGFIAHNNTVTSFAMPGTTETAPLGINNLGEIVGAYIPTGSNDELPFAKIGDLYTLLSVPQAIYPGATATNATGVNDAGVIVGYIGAAGSNFLNGFIATPVAGAPLDIALAGGDAAAPVMLPLSKINSVSSAIGGGVSSQFYSFDWSGGAFAATLSLTGADQAMSYAFQLCSGSSCGTVLDSKTLKYDQWTGTLTDDLAAGTYTIGLLEHQPGVDPYFTLSFQSAVSSAVPEPAAWALLLIGFGSVGSLVRARRRRIAA